MRRRDFDRCVREALDSLPDEFRTRLENVLITVQDEPDPELLEEMDSETLLGIYLGSSSSRAPWRTSVRPRRS